MAVTTSQDNLTVEIAQLVFLVLQATPFSVKGVACKTTCIPWLLLKP